MIQVGDRISIHQKPISREEYEGQAKVLAAKVIDSTIIDGRSYDIWLCTVDFENGRGPVERTVYHYMKRLS